MDAHFVFRLLRREILIYGAFYLPCFLQELRVEQGILTHEKYTGMNERRFHAYRRSCSIHRLLESK